MSDIGSRYYILDADNHPVKVDLMTWAIWFEDANRRIGYTQITSQCEVSTVFLGIDLRYFSEGPPILFETMIFGGPKEIDESQWRYSSFDDAMVGHLMAVDKARAAIGQKVTP